MPQSTIGGRLQKARQSAGFASRATFAHAVSAIAIDAGRQPVDPSSIWRYENDKSVPRTETLHACARVAGVSLEWLLTGDGDGPRAVTK